MSVDVFNAIAYCLHCGKPTTVLVAEHPDEVETYYDLVRKEYCSSCGEELFYEDIR